MKGSLAALLTGLGILLVSACTTGPEYTRPNVPILPLDTPRESIQSTIIDHKLNSQGQDLPEWVSRYLNEGVRGIEAMPEFQDAYVFIDEAAGPNREALSQWLAGYRVVQDFRRLVSIRVQDRFIKGSSGFPDRVYGRYFEYVVRAVSDTSYPGARLVEDYWVLKRFLPQEDGTSEPDTYQVFILISIDRKTLEVKINSLLNQYKAQGKPNRTQLAAIERINETFFVTF